MVQPFARAGLGALLSLGLFGQSPETQPAFEIADVHASPHSVRPSIQGGYLRGDRYVLHQATMLELISTAYGFEAGNVLGGPNWLELDRFDIVAKAPPATPAETLKLMLQALLADRFKLVLHKDTKSLDAFVLTAGKGKPKLKESDGTGGAGCHQQPMPPPEPGKIGQITYSCHNMTTEAFAAWLHQNAPGYLTSPVVDTTGLKGAWDFDIKWTARGAIAEIGEGITIFDAVDKQLGLKLQLQKYRAPVLVVDSANEKPTENPQGVKQTLPPPPPVEFEVAALKPSLPDAKMGGRGFQPGGRIDFTAIPLSGLIGAAWNLSILPGDEIPGAPKWVNSVKFDLVAKAYATASTTTSNAPANGNPDIDIDDLRLMLRALLVDRLKMVTHYEDRPQTAYTLVAGKPKLKPADPLNRTGCKVGPPPLGKDPPKGGPPQLQATCRNMTMAQFVEQIPTIAQLYIRNPVIDASGIEGAWDFTLTFNLIPPTMNLGGGGGGRGDAPAPGSATGAPADAAEPSTAISFFDAVERQLGLRLEMRKRNLPVLVIDHIEEKPDN